MMTQHISPDIKKKAAVLGVGRMGAAISFAMKELGFFVLGLDTNEEAAKPFRKHIESSENGAFYRLDLESGAQGKNFDDVLVHENPDVVISSLPYHQTENVAYWCIDNGIRYCDLGGRVDVSERINEYAKDAKAPIITDLGLAPGWVNILAEQGCKEIHKTPDEVTMMVGGLPGIPDNPPLNYVMTWSVDGLINEYADNCEILINGNVEKVPGMMGLESVKVDCIRDELEAFYTSGGASHTIRDMQERGVKHCSYKTLRWKGHRDTVNFLIRKCNLTKECLLQIFKKGCASATGSSDIVILKVFIKSGDIEWNKEILVPYDLTFSAMQKATAFSAASVASQLAKGTLEGGQEQHRDYWVNFPKALSYKHINYQDFCNDMRKLGISL